MKYDAIIAGASFAGLSVATQLKGKILLIDRKDISSLPTSACATYYEVLRSLGCEDSVLQILGRVRFQTSFGCIKYQTVEPFCTFDYREFCLRLAHKFHGEFLKANVLGFEDGQLITDKGSFFSPCIVDCTGWRARLASSIQKDFVSKEELFFGAETEVYYQSQGQELSFFMDPKVIETGYAWIFPAGERCRFGLGSYTGNTNLMSRLREFVTSFGLSMGRVHGGFIPFKLRKPTVGHLFLVGDSAGQAFPTTGEGIRQSIYFGQRCGQIIQKVIDGECTLEEALKEYHHFVHRHRFAFSLLLRIQGWLLWMPNKRIDLAARILGRGFPIKFIQTLYINYIKVKPLP